MKMTRTLGTGMLMAMLCATTNLDAHPPVVSAKTTSKVFTQNVGQVTDQHFKQRNDIDFKLSAGNRLNIFIGSGKLHYQFSHNLAGSNETPSIRDDDHTDNAVEMYRMDVELIGSNANAKIIAEDRAALFERYYTNGLQGAVANKYSRITYKDIYPHIDWVFYFNAKGQLEHDFIVHKGGKVSDIKMRYSGATQLMLNDDGSLTAYTPFGTVKENTPYAYQQQDKKTVASTFVLNDDVISFSTADHKGTLVIDPVLEWGTYYGDVEVDHAYATTVGKYGEVYIAGTTSSTSNIVTTGTHQTIFGGGTFAGGADAFLSKFDINGQLLWATYYGDTGIDIAKAVDCDTMGNVYMAGYSNSPNAIASAGSHQPNKAGTAAQYDAFLVKFDTSGMRIWGTYYGGDAQEGPGTSFIGLHCDSMNHIYLTGNTASTSGIATNGAFQNTKSGTTTGTDAFLAQFDTSASLQWGTYIGGSSADYGCAVTSDGAGNIYVTGYSNSADQIGTAGTHQVTIGGGYDGFILKFDVVGQRLWGTYLGGDANDRGYSIVCDDSANIYLAGITLSATAMATPNSHQSSIGGGQDGYLARFDSSGILNWGTYYGGSASDNALSLCHATNGYLYLAGSSSSAVGIASVNGLIPQHIGGLDVFVAKFGVNGSREWGTYFGGINAEIANAIAPDRIGNLFIAGQTNSATGIATATSHQLTFGGGSFDGLLIRLNDCEAPDAPLAITGDAEICSNDTILYSIAAVAEVDGYSWILPSGWIGNSDSTSILTTPDNNQSGIIQVAAVNYCTTSDTISLAVTVKPAPEPLIQRNNNILSTTQPYSSYQWNRNGQAIGGATNSTYIVSQNGDYTVTVTAANDCEATSDVHTIDHLSNEYFKDLQFDVYPNPASNIVHVEVKTNGTMELHDVTGRLLLSEHLSAGANTVDINKLQNGIYLLKVLDSDGSYKGTMKLLKTQE